MFIVLFVLSILFASLVFIPIMLWIKNKIFKTKPRKEDTLDRRDILIIGLVLLFLSLLLARCSVSMSSPDIAVSDSTQEEQVIEQSQNEQKVERHQLKPRDVAGILNASASLGVVAANTLFTGLADTVGWYGTITVWLVIMVISLVIAAINIPMWTKFLKSR